MFSWHAIPFARVLIPFICGIVLCLQLPSGPLDNPILPVILLALLLLFKSTSSQKTHFRFRWIPGIILSLGVFSLGYLRTNCHDETKLKGHYSAIAKARFFHITIDDAVIEKTRFYRCYASVDEVHDSLGITHKSHGLLLLYFNKRHLANKPVIGERFLVRARATGFNDAPNPGEFSFRKYLANRNIHYQLFADSLHTIKSGSHKSSVYRYAIIFRDKCLEIMRRHISSKRELGVAEALLMGYKDDLDPDITSAFSRTGTLHVLAVSGLHAGIIFLLISFLTRSFQNSKRGKWVQLVLLLSGLWFYAFMTGLSSSVLRASVMFSIVSAGKVLKHRSNIYNTLFASAFLLLVYNPLYLLDAGFQLSYLAVFGIVWIQPVIDKWYYPRYKLDKHAWGLLSVSLAAQVLTFPVSIFYFHQFPNYFLLSNLLIIPLTTFILIGIIILLALNWMSILAVWIGKAIYGMIWLSNLLVTSIDKLPYSFVNGLHINFTQMILLYGIIICFCLFITAGKTMQLVACLACSSLFAGIASYRAYGQNHQKIFTAHVIKGHDVFTCIEGRNAYIISDSVFLADTNSIHFFLEPHLWSRGIREIKKLDLRKNFVSTNMKVIKGIGFQFYDNTMTIQNLVQNTIQKGQIILLKQFDYHLFKLREKYPNSFIISQNLSKKQFYKIRKEYFNHFRKNLEMQKTAVSFFTM